MSHQTKRRNLLRSAAALTFSAALSIGLVNPAAADELDDQQARANSNLAAGQAWAEELDGNLAVATQNLAASRQSLADARATLARAEAERDAAQGTANTRAAELKQAEQQLSTTTEQVAQAQQAVDKQRAKAASDMRTSHQQNTVLLSVGMLVNNGTTSDVSQRMQWAQTLYNANSAELNQLTNLQLELQAQQKSQAELENSAHLARVEAEQSLARAAQAQADADAAASAVDQQVKANETAEQGARAAVEQQRAINAQMQAESDDVARQIYQRNQERARQAEMERQRQAEAARQREAAAAANRQAAAPAPAQAPAWQPAPAPAPQPAARNSTLATPANGPYTSPYGYRVNPVLGYSEFHDGLDIGTGCGTPIYAAESGRVEYVGWAGGWGNRAVIDHGYVNGVQLSTGYNHAQSFIVGPGQWVSRGQQIGYNGTTGLSTGCHLHFHVWANGSHTNPVNYL